MQDLFHIFGRLLMVLLVASMVAVSARRSEENTWPDNSQMIADPEANQMIDSEMKQLQMEMLARRLGADIGPIGFQRDLRSETERKRRFRACYFNPVSCFK